MMMRSDRAITRNYSNEESSLESALPTTQIKSDDLSTECDGDSAPPRQEVAASPIIEDLIEELRAPKDFIDPLNSHLMKDPVVLSTGYIVDRDTVMEDGNMIKFKRCPFTGKELNSSVYPLDEKKKQIESFTKLRDQNVTKIVSKLISEGKYESFHEISDDIESYQKKRGEKHVSLTRKLTEIWSESYRGLPSTTLFVEHLKIKDGHSWITAVESGLVENKIYKILVSAEIFKDKGKGSHKSFLALSLYDHEENLVDRCKLFKDSRNPYCTFGKKDTIVSNARAGYTYKLEYNIGSSPKYVQVEGLICKIFPIVESTSSFRMRDADGEEGLYIGQLDAKRNADGEGSLEYDDGKRFVGMFQDGAMIDGVLYRGPFIRYTLKRGKWTRSIDDVLVEKYPSNSLVYDESGFLAQTKTKKRGETIEKDETANGVRHQRKDYKVREDYSVSAQDKYKEPYNSRSKTSVNDGETRWADRESRGRKPSVSPDKSRKFQEPFIGDADEFSRASRYDKNVFEDSSAGFTDTRQKDKRNRVGELPRYDYHGKQEALQESPKSSHYKESYGMEERDDTRQYRSRRYNRDPLEHNGRY